MVVKSKDYKAIEALDTHLNDIKEHKKDIKALEQKITNLRRTSLSPSDTTYPYGKLMDERDEFITNRNIFSTIGATFIFLIIYGILFAGVLFASFVFNRLGHYSILASRIGFLTPRSTGIVVLILLIVFALVILVLTYRVLIEGILKFQHSFKDWRFTKRNKAAFEDAYEKTQSLIEDKRLSIKREISELTTTKEAKESEIRGIEKKIMEIASIPPRLIDKVSKIKQYFEESRVDTIKDAINLLIKEEREEYFFNEIKETLHAQQSSIDALSEKIAIIRKSYDQPVKKEKTAFEEKVEKSKKKRKPSKKENKEDTDNNEQDETKDNV